jgi:alpha-tubulin suppressor-like RCC1 family protein
VVTAAAVGLTSACALLSDGTVKCWGANQDGELGDGTTTNSTAPVAVAILSKVTAISAGNDFACALAGSSVKCWGANASGQLGDGKTVEEDKPGGVLGLSGVRAISAGADFTCAVRGTGASSDAECWGANDLGQLGDGTTTGSSRPVLVKSTSSSLTTNGASAIAAGSGHACVLISGGRARCWGDNEDGQLGDGSTTNSTTPVAVANLPTTPVALRAKAISAGGLNTCALLGDGTVECWGANNVGQLGNGTITSSSLPVAVANLSGVMAIATGNTFSCALLADGTVDCWGRIGLLAKGTRLALNSTVPVAVANLSGVTAISAGTNGACALLSDGNVECWGADDFGQLGDGQITTGELTNSATPVRVVFGTAPYVGFGSACSSPGECPPPESPCLLATCDGTCGLTNAAAGTLCGAGSGVGSKAVPDTCDGSGTCLCAASEQRCGGACVDELTDEQNCGTCGAACATGVLCIGGRCAKGVPGVFTE